MLTLHVATLDVSTSRAVSRSAVRAPMISCQWSAFGICGPSSRCLITTQRFLVRL